MVNLPRKSMNTGTPRKPDAGVKSYCIVLPFPCRLLSYTISIQNKTERGGYALALLPLSCIIKIEPSVQYVTGEIGGRFLAIQATVF